MDARLVAAVAACLALAACKTTEPPGAPQDPVAAAAHQSRLVADAQRCAVTTRQPKDLTIEPAGTNVPEQYQRFLGVWSGTWNGGSCGTFVVTKVAADGAAAAIYSWDPGLGHNDENPMSVRGRIDGDGELSIGLGAWQTEVVYRFASPDVLHGRYYRNGVWDIDMVKVSGPTADAGAVGSVAAPPGGTIGG